MDEEDTCGNATQRKQQRQRQAPPPQQQGDPSATTKSGTTDPSTTTVAAGTVPPATSVAEAVASTRSNDRTVAFTGTVQLRMLLSLEGPPIDEVIKAGVVPRLIQFLSLADDPKFQCEALWALTNICSGSRKQTAEVIKCGIGPPVIALLSSSPDAEVCEQAAWALGNISGDGVAHRDYVLRLGFFPALLSAMVRFPNHIAFLRNATWALSNGCRGKPSPDISYFQPSAGESSVSLIATLVGLLQCSDVDVMSDVAWTLSYLTDSPPCVKMIISTGTIIPSLVRLLSLNNVQVCLPAVRALGNVATGSAEETQSLIDAGIFQAVTPFLLGVKKILKKESIWLLSNIAGGTKEQVAAICQSGVVPHVVTCLSSGDLEIHREACWVICNCIETNDCGVLRYMISMGVIEPLRALLERYSVNYTQSKLIILILTALQKLLATGTETPNKLWASNSRLSDTVSDLQLHRNTTIYSMATQLLDKYAPDEVSTVKHPNEDDEDDGDGDDDNCEDDDDEDEEEEGCEDKEEEKEKGKKKEKEGNKQHQNTTTTTTNKTGGIIRTTSAHRGSVAEPVCTSCTTAAVVRRNDGYGSGLVIDSGVAESLVRNVDNLQTLSALDRVNKLLHSFASIKLKELRMQHRCCVKWVTERDQSLNVDCWDAHRGIKVCVAGDSASGKTCIVEMLTGKKFIDEHETTVGARFVVTVAPLAGGTVKLELWDTGGQERFRSLLPMYYRHAAAILLVYDVTDSTSLTALTRFLTEIRVRERASKLLLCGNKSDMNHTAARSVTYSQGLEFAKSSNCDGFIEVSAKTMKNIPELLTGLSQLALEGAGNDPKPYAIRRPTGRLGPGDRQPTGGGCHLM
ncbi:importin subunit alpha-1 [Pelomyxa schiedti]|nr:importin subunit alpha-1 [Pelomyxa schiedti]